MTKATANKLHLKGPALRFTNNGNCWIVPNQKRG
jgi:hypothetical protein